MRNFNQAVAVAGANYPAAYLFDRDARRVRQTVRPLQQPASQIASAPVDRGGYLATAVTATGALVFGALLVLNVATSLQVPSLF